MPSWRGVPYPLTNALSHTPQAYVRGPPGAHSPPLTAQGKPVTLPYGLSHAALLPRPTSRHAHTHTPAARTQNGGEDSPRRPSCPPAPQWPQLGHPQALGGLTPGLYVPWVEAEDGQERIDVQAGACQGLVVGQAQVVTQPPQPQRPGWGRLVTAAWNVEVLGEAQRVRRVRCG